ncbi:MAG: hypothetical protein BWY47_01929 [Bacteroidetes bacterium ADurb.Bin302]|nr:MAG: hypothetical protein BWY47_01929 [Bacteroidetes bacterium ADurb.Bin302]
MKVLTKVSYKNLDGICQKGDVLTLEVVRHTEDCVIHHTLYGGNHPVWGFVLYPVRNKINLDKLPDWAYKVSDANIAPKGSMKSLVVITKDGRRYPWSTIVGAIGYFKIDKLFEKIN